MARRIKIDIHNHLRTSSHIPASTANGAIKAGGKRLGAGGIFGVINFDSFTGETDSRWNNFRKNLRYDVIDTKNGVYIPEEDILAVRGQEVRTRKGYEFLVVGVTPEEDIHHGISVDQFFNRAIAIRAFTIAVHPFHKHGSQPLFVDRPEFFGRVGGYEIFNGESAFNIDGINDANGQARRYLADKAKSDPKKFPAAVITSDGHSLSELGRSYSSINMPDDYKSFRDSPNKLVNYIQRGYHEATTLGEHIAGTSVPNRLGAINHALDLVALIGLSKLTGLDPNTQIAPLIQRLTLGLYKL